MSAENVAALHEKVEIGLHICIYVCRKIYIKLSMDANERSEANYYGTC